ELQLQDVEKPVPKDDQVLIKVRAACLNSWDWDLLQGTYFFVRVLGGMFKPKYKILGCDVAGIVKSVGKDVKEFRPGDEVFGDLSGDNFGCFAEYVCGSAKHLATKPAELSFEDACTIPQAGLLALQGLRLKGELQPGMEVLINGAGGGVGMFAIQLAKIYGCTVTGVDRSSKFDIMRELGADRVIDYQSEDFTLNGKKYDFILENIATRSMWEYQRALTPSGTFVMTGGKTPRIFQLLFFGKFLSRGGKKLRLVGLKYSPEDLTYLAGLVVDGKIKPVIDKVFPLEETSDAFHHFGKGDYKGKVVVAVEH
ncbi:MAG: NAD(P)-dependent alcohol dehydrogenase, partial [Cyclobacteriaceae bacterium]